MVLKKFRWLVVLAILSISSLRADSPDTPNQPASATPQHTQAASPAPTSSDQTVSVFAETGAYTGNQILGTVGVSVSIAGNQEIFGAIGTMTGAAVAQNSQVLFGIKSNLPSFTSHGYKVTPFSIVGYGASIESLKTLKVSPPAGAGLNASTVTSIATQAGLAQQYAFGFQTVVKGFTVGIGGIGDRSVSGWSGYPFVFIGKTLK